MAVFSTICALVGVGACSFLLLIAAVIMGIIRFIIPKRKKKEKVESPGFADSEDGEVIDTDFQEI